MPANTMSSPKTKRCSSHSLQGQMIDVSVRRMAALEAKVERLESQVAELQSQLQEKGGQRKTTVSPHSKAIVPDILKTQKAKSPVREAAVLQENSGAQGVSRKDHDTPTKILIQQHTNNVLIDLTPKKEDVQAPPVVPSTRSNANIASSCAFVKVTGPMGSCEVGAISTTIDHTAALQLDIDTEDGALWISSSLMKKPMKGFSAQAQFDDRGILEMGVAFRSAQIVPKSLQFGQVVDTLLLPPAILDQLEDPNEVPPNLYFMTWKYYSCGADGFEQFQSTNAKFDQKDRIMKLYRHILGHRQTVQVWFITDEKYVEESFECLKALCYRQPVRDWLPCSGHEGKHTKSCPFMGNNRKGVVQFLEQSAPPS